MPDIYLDTETYNQASADVWERQTNTAVADRWAAGATAQAPDLIAQTQRQADEAAAAQQRQSAAAVSQYDAQAHPQERVGMRASVADALRAKGWPEASIDRVLSSSVFNGMSIDQLNAQEDQRQAQASATGGYYGGATPQPVVPKAGDVGGWRNWIQQFVPDDLKNDPEFTNTVLAGAHGESSLDPQSVQPNGNGRGLFQFDTSPGAMGEGLSQDQLFDPYYQASRIVPVYADVYRSAPAGMSAPERASWVAAHAERPLDYGDPASAARRNYVRSYNVVATAPTDQTMASVASP